MAYQSLQYDKLTTPHFLFFLQSVFCGVRKDEEFVRREMSENCRVSIKPHEIARNDLRSQSLDLLRFPLAVVILIIHTFDIQELAIHGQEYSVNIYSGFVAINHFISGFLRQQSVPIYFFISGFVFFLGRDWTTKIYIRKLKNRVHTLLIPYVIWNTVALLLPLIYLLPCFSALFPNVHKLEWDFSLSRIFSSYWNLPQEINNFGNIWGTTAPIDGPLWFIRDLMIVVLCTPILYWLLKRVRHYLIWLLGILWFMVVYFDLGRVDQLLSAFFFFSWGAYMSVNGKDMLAEFGRFSRWTNILYPLLALFYITAAYCWPEVAVTIRLNILVGLIFAYNLAVWLLKCGICKVNRFLASSSFFIYITHGIIIALVLKGVFYLIRPDSGFSVFLVYALAVGVTLTFLLMSFYLLRRYTPGLLKVMTGRK